MAEGDTILRAARRLDAALTGETVAATAPNPRGRAARVERLDGRRLDAVESHGKNLLLRFGDVVLHSHMGMNGSWHVYPRGAPWRKPRRSAWAVLAGEKQEAVQFGGPTLRLLAADRARRDPQLAPPRPHSPPPPPPPPAPPPGPRASETSSRARPASRPASTPGARSATSVTRTCARSSSPPAS